MYLKKYNLKGKYSLVTGAGKGLGRACAIALAEAGSNLILISRTQKDLDSVAKIAKKHKVKCKTYVCDLTNYLQLKQVINSQQKIDVLINNAGIIRDRSILKMTRDEWDMVQSVNVDSLFVTTKAVLPYMKASNYGRIISASSINAFQGAFGQTNYSASKAAIVGFTHSLCREVGKYNITVNAVAPGFIKSEMTDSMPDEIIKAGIAQIPVGRIGTPEDMAHAYLFLASKEAGFVSGHTLHANGGAMPF